MAKLQFKDKDKSVLSLIVEDYIENGRPVSSGQISRKTRFKGSPATIRNIMARLEKDGFLHQPHTSSGRIPTDKGLKYYVNNLLAGIQQPSDDAMFLRNKAAESKGHLGSLLDDVSRILAEHSDNVGFVISPHIARVVFRHLRFIKLAENKVMAVLVTPSHMVLTETVEARHLFTQTELDRASLHINRNYSGRSLHHVRDVLLRELPRTKAKYENVLDKLIALIRACTLTQDEEHRIHIQGASRLLGKADVFEMDKLQSIFQSIEEKACLTKLLSDFISLDRVKVLIGSEINFPNVPDCSLVLSHYGYDDQVLGSLGIIGPKRIPYDRIIPLVDSMAKGLSRALASTSGDVVL